MKQNEQLNEILALVCSRRLGKAINSLENYLLTYPRQAETDEFMAIREDYRLMAEYWQRGFDDPQREAVSEQILRRMYMLTASMATNWQLNNSAFMKSLHLRPRKIRKDWSMTAVRGAMETFVANVALLQLEPENTRQQRGADTYRQHFELMRDLFDYTITSRQWSEGLADAFIDMLLSPTLSSNDQQLIVSAITLAALQSFCFQKFRVLAEVYRQATDEPLRQRALVGWVLTACRGSESWKLYTEVGDMVARLCEDEGVRAELAELQLQLVYCTDADADRDTIQKEILPDIMSGSNIRVAGGRLVEMDEDTLDDILHPEASELAMERMEQSMQRMVDMQKQGADIYFGGFSQMKRFHFFDDVCNWFVPFYSQHPAISEIWNNTRGKKFLKAITRLGAFCDSDKYSFVLAFNQVLDRLPQGMLKLIEDGEASATPLGGEVSIEDQEQPAFMRRVYLQNLYRFFRLFPARSEFYNPFDTANFRSSLLFLAHPLFGIPHLAQQSLSSARFLMKRRRYADAAAVLGNLSEDKRDFQYYMMMGATLQHITSTSLLSPLECYRQALQLQPGNERALSGMARALFGNQEYEDAFNAYQKLMDMNAEQQSYQLNAAVCLVNLGRSDEALKLLYKLNYLHPDDLSVTRVMAWTLTVAGKHEQADKLYCQLLALEKPLPTDMLNYGYSLWLSRNIVSAIGMFRQYVSTQDQNNDNLEKQFMDIEHELLSTRGINDTEIQLMLDAVMA